MKIVLLILFIAVVGLAMTDHKPKSNRYDEYKKFNKKIRHKNDSEYVKSLKRKMK